MNLENFTFRQIEADTEIKPFDCGQMVIMQIKMIFSRMTLSGCRFITVDAYSNAVPFYEKCGFHCLSDKDRDEPTRAMYFDLMYYKKRS